MSGNLVGMIDFTILFVSFCHAVIFNVAQTRGKSAQNFNNSIKNNLPTCLLFP